MSSENNNNVINVNMYANIKVSNTLPCERREKLNKRFETNTMNILVSNCNGLKSKFQSVSNICKENDIRMMILTETHEAGGVAPFVDRAYKPFFLNRNEQKYQRCKGGVAILVESQMAQHCVIIDKLKIVNEVIILRNNAFRPALITVGIYGGQPTQYSTDEVRNAWSELLIKINEYHKKRPHGHMGRRLQRVDRQPNRPGEERPFNKRKWQNNN